MGKFASRIAREKDVRITAVASKDDKYDTRDLISDTMDKLQNARVFDYGSQTVIEVLQDIQMQEQIKRPKESARRSTLRWEAMTAYGNALVMDIIADKTLYQTSVHLNEKEDEFGKLLEHAVQKSQTSSEKKFFSGDAFVKKLTAEIKAAQEPKPALVRGA